MNRTTKFNRDNNVLLCVVALLLVTLLSSCIQYRNVVTPKQRVPENPYYSVDIQPVCKSLCYSFIVTVTNKYHFDLEIDWNRSLYIDQGATSGGFMFEGLAFVDRHSPKPSDIVFANSSLSKEIFPNSYSYYRQTKYSGSWRHNSIPKGEHGIYLTVHIDGQTFRNKVTVMMDRQKVEQ